MKQSRYRIGKAVVVVLMVLVLAFTVFAQSGNPPPIDAPLIREGDFAVRLFTALGLGTTEDEVEAENRLGEVGIAPRNGWIADYPMTPDIIGELQDAVGSAADSNKLSMNKQEALKILNDVAVEMGLSVTPYSGSAPPRKTSPRPKDIQILPTSMITFTATVRQL